MADVKSMNHNPKNQFQKGHKVNLGRTGFWNGKRFGDEHLKHLSEAHLGKISGMLGYRHTENTKKLISMKKIGRRLPSITGEKHPNWKGGITPYYQQLKNSLGWKKWRRLVFERDDWTCRICGYSYKYDRPENRDLHPHHCITVKDLVKTLFEKHIFNIDNGLTVCKNCHLTL